MTVRELLRAALEFTTDIDREVKIRVVHRDPNGVVIADQMVPIYRWSNFSGGPCIVLEQSDLEAAKLEKV